MITTLPKIAPLSDMRLHQAEILQQAQKGPVLLIERGSKPALVAITPELWNSLAQRIEELEDAVAIWKKRWELATGKDELIDLTPEMLAAWSGDGLPS
ncbi:MAG: hypothetical protein U0175_15130 [Caldilineaceae bacterium]